MRDRPLVGRDYESAVISGAFCGFCDGRYRDGDRQHAGVDPSPRPVARAFVIVPIVGAFFIDLINLAVLTLPGFIIGR